MFKGQVVVNVCFASECLESDAVGSSLALTALMCSRSWRKIPPKILSATSLRPQGLST